MTKIEPSKAAVFIIVLFGIAIFINSTKHHNYSATNVRIQKPVPVYVPPVAAPTPAPAPAEWPIGIPPVRELTMPDESLIDSSIPNQRIKQTDDLFMNEDVKYNIKPGWMVSPVISGNLTLLDIAYNNKIILLSGVQHEHNHEDYSQSRQLRFRSRNQETMHIEFNLEKVSP